MATVHACARPSSAVANSAYVSTSDSPAPSATRLAGTGWMVAEQFSTPTCGA